MSLFRSTLIPLGAKNAAERPLEPLGPSLVAACTGFYILSMLALRLSLHSTVEDTPEGRRWRRRRYNAVLVLALADLLTAGLSWIAPIAGYLAMAVTIVYVLMASHPADLERRMRWVGERAAGSQEP